MKLFLLLVAVTVLLLANTSVSFNVKHHISVDKVLPVNNVYKKMMTIVSLSSFLLVSSPSMSSATDAVTTTVKDTLPVTNTISKVESVVVTPSGLKYSDAVLGDGAAVTEGKSVQLKWVLRRPNGYFVASSNDDYFIYKVGNLKKAIAGIDEGIRGMKAGGIRRLNIPPALAFNGCVEEGCPGPVPVDFGPQRQILSRPGEVWYMEVKVVKVK